MTIKNFEVEIYFSTHADEQPAVFYIDAVDFNEAIDTAKSYIEYPEAIDYVDCKVISNNFYKFN